MTDLQRGLKGREFLVRRLLRSMTACCQAAFVCDAADCRKLPVCSLSAPCSCRAHSASGRYCLDLMHAHCCKNDSYYP